MLLLLVHIAGQLYCIRAASVLEVVPRVPLQPVPHAPAALAGLLHYRGEVIPVLDLRTLLEGGASDAFLSTRIVVVETSCLKSSSNRFLDDSTTRRLVGLIAERLTETLEVDASAIAPAPVDVAAAPFLGGLLVQDGRVIRELLVDRFPVEATA